MKSALFYPIEQMATRWFVHEAKKARQAEGLRVSCFDTPEDLLQAWAVVENRWQC